MSGYHHPSNPHGRRLGRPIAPPAAAPAMADEDSPQQPAAPAPAPLAVEPASRAPTGGSTSPPPGSGGALDGLPRARPAPDTKADAAAAGFYRRQADQQKAAEKAAEEARQAEIAAGNYETQRRAAREGRQTLVNPATGSREFVHSDEEVAAKTQAEEQKKAEEEKFKAKQDRRKAEFDAQGRAYRTDHRGRVVPTETAEAVAERKATQEREAKQRKRAARRTQDVAALQAIYDLEKLDRPTLPERDRDETAREAGEAELDAIYEAANRKDLPDEVRGEIAAMRDRADGGADLDVSALSPAARAALAEASPDRWAAAEAARAALARDDEAREWHDAQARAIAAAKLRKTSPKAWKAMQAGSDGAVEEMEEDAASGPTEKKTPTDEIDAVEEPDPDSPAALTAAYEVRTTEFAGRLGEFTARVEEETRRWTELQTENEVALRTTGVPLDEIVTMEDGSRWLRSLVPRVEQMASRAEKIGDREEIARAALEAEAAELDRMADDLRSKLRDTRDTQRETEAEGLAAEIETHGLEDLEPALAELLDAVGDLDDRRDAIAEDPLLGPAEKRAAYQSLDEEETRQRQAFAQAWEAAEEVRYERITREAAGWAEVESAAIEFAQQMAEMQAHAGRSDARVVPGDGDEAPTVKGGADFEQRQQFATQQRERVKAIAERSGLPVTEVARMWRDIADESAPWGPGERWRQLGGSLAVVMNPSLTFDDEGFAAAIEEARENLSSRAKSPEDLAAIEERLEKAAATDRERQKDSMAPWIVMGLRKVPNFARFEARQMDLPYEDRPKSEREMLERYTADVEGADARARRRAGTDYRPNRDATTLIVKQGAYDISKQFLGFGAALNYHTWAPLAGVVSPAAKEAIRGQAQGMLEDLGQSGSAGLRDRSMNDALDAMGIAQFPRDLGRGAISTLPSLGSGFAGMTLRGATSAAIARSSRLGNIALGTPTRLIGGQTTRAIGPRAARRMAEKSAGLGGSMAGGFMQSFGATIPEAIEAYQAQGYLFEDAAAAAVLPAAGAATFTAVSIGAFGKTGVEALLRTSGKGRPGEVSVGDLARWFDRNPARRAEWKKAVRSPEFRELVDEVLAGTLREPLAEMAQEGLDELFQSWVAMGTYEQEMSVSEMFERGVHGAVLGLFLGGAAGTIRTGSLEARKMLASEIAATLEKKSPARPAPTTPPPAPPTQDPVDIAPHPGPPPAPPAAPSDTESTAPDRVAAAEATIEAFEGSGQDIEWTPEAIESAKARARALSQVARGKHEDLTAAELAEIGLERDKEGRITERKASLRQSATEIFPMRMTAVEGGDVIILEAGLDFLGRYFPAVRDTVALDETGARRMFSERRAAAEEAKQAPSADPEPRSTPEEVAQAAAEAGAAMDAELEEAGFREGEPIAEPPPPATEEQARSARVADLAAFAREYYVIDRDEAQAWAEDTVDADGIGPGDAMSQFLAAQQSTLAKSHRRKPPGMREQKPDPETAVETLIEEFEGGGKGRFGALADVELVPLSEAIPAAATVEGGAAIWASPAEGKVYYVPEVFESAYGVGPGVSPDRMRAMVRQTVEHEMFHVATWRALVEGFRAKGASQAVAEQKAEAEIAGIYEATKKAHPEDTAALARIYGMDWDKHPTNGGYELLRMALEWRRSETTTERVYHPDKSTQARADRAMSSIFGERGGFRLTAAMKRVLRAAIDWIRGRSGELSGLWRIVEAAEALLDDGAVFTPEASPLRSPPEPGTVYRRRGVRAAQVEVVQISEDGQRVYIREAGAEDGPTWDVSSETFAQTYIPLGRKLRPKKRRRQRKAKAYHDKRTPVSNTVRDLGGIMSLLVLNRKLMAARSRQAAGKPPTLEDQKHFAMLQEYNDAPKREDFPRAVAEAYSSLFSQRSVKMPDQMAGALLSDHNIGDGTVAGMWEAIRSEMGTLARSSGKGAFAETKWARRWREMGEFAEEQGVTPSQLIAAEIEAEFQQHALPDPEDTTRTIAGVPLAELVRVTREDLGAGDRVWVDGEELMVETDPHSDGVFLSNGYEPSRFGETMVAVGPGEAVYVQRHEPAGGVEPMAPAPRRALRQEARHARLEAKAADGTITQAEITELESLRDAAGQGSLFDGEEFAPQSAGVRAQKQARLQRAEMIARQKATLAGEDASTQEDLFRDPQEDGGQGLLFASAPERGGRPGFLARAAARLRGRTEEGADPDMADPEPDEAPSAPREMYGKRRETPLDDLSITRDGVTYGDENDAGGTEGTGREFAPGPHRVARAAGENPSRQGEALVRGFPLDERASGIARGRLPEAKGDEHYVWLDPERGRVIKRTRPGVYGAGRDATPASYLERLLRQNNEFGDSIAFLGAEQASTGEILLYTEQPIYEGPIPSEADLEAWFARRGYVRTGASQYYDGTRVVEDAAPRNVADMGEAGMMPFDVIVRSPASSEESRLDHMYEAARRDSLSAYSRARVEGAVFAPRPRRNPNDRYFDFGTSGDLGGTADQIPLDFGADRGDTGETRTPAADDLRSRPDLERHRPAGGDAGGQDSLFPGWRPDRGDGGRVGGSRGGSRHPAPDRIPPDDLFAAIGGELGHPEPGSDPTPDTPSPAGDGDTEGSSRPDEAGVAPERFGDGDPATSLDSAGPAPGTLAPSGDLGHLADIQRTAPALTPEQAADVAFLETRFAAHQGALLTNGTGTGKTFSGMGLIARLLERGAKSILVVAPSDKVGSDWVKTAFDYFDVLDAVQLRDTRDNGDGNRITVTTYANLGANDAIGAREWDAIIADEAHYLSQNKDGADTRSLRAVRALTMHEDGASRYAEMQRPDLAETVARIAAIEWRTRTAEQNEEMRAAGEQLQALADRRREEVEAVPKAERPKVLMLSATPFAYHFSLDYGAGYLYDLPQVEQSSAYNAPSARDSFYISNLGYRMRTGKLTSPENATAVGILERRLAERLMSEGAMAGRALEVDQDYGRQFVLTPTRVGEQIDEILAAIRDPENDLSALRDRIGLGDYLARRYLFEGLKARESLGRVRKHLALGRKVVVFHDYKKGGAENPLPSQLHGEFSTWEGGGFRTVQIADLLDKLKRIVPHYEETRAELSGLRSPIDLYHDTFGERVGIFNGSVPKGRRKSLVDQFNEPGSGLDILLVQRASGKEGISLHDRAGDKQRVLIDLGFPSRPTDAIQGEGRIYRLGVQSPAIFEYITTGTDTERHTFAQTIATRSSTAENLAMGSRARALLQAFADGYNDASAVAPGPEQGRGGKEMDAARHNANPFADAVALYYTNQKKTARTKAAEGVDYFATPEPLGFKMVDWSHIGEGEKILEPSAGHGAIARFFPDATNRHAVEPSFELASRLMLNATDTQVHQVRFEDYSTNNKFDVINMNPPFGRAGKLAAEHLEKAAQHLRLGGRLVAILPNSPTMDQRVEAFLQSKEGADIYRVAEYEIPGIAFARAGTTVATKVVIFDKTDWLDGLENTNYREFRAETIEEFFEQLESVQAPPRARTKEAVAPADFAETTEGSEAPTVPPVAGETTAAPAFLAPGGPAKFSAAEGWHAKKGVPTYVAKIDVKLARPDYETALAAAKRQGGYYSSFKGAGAVPGFQFASVEARDAFLADATGSGPVSPLAQAPRRGGSAPAGEQDTESRSAIVEMPGGEAVYYVADPNAIKSADPVTRDESGEVIPLSQRFNPESPSILFASAPIRRSISAMPEKPRAFLRALIAGEDTGAAAERAGYAKGRGDDLARSIGRRLVKAMESAGVPLEDAARMWETEAVRHWAVREQARRDGLSSESVRPGFRHTQAHGTPESSFLAAEVERMQREIDEAYEAGDHARAEDLDARLEEMLERIDSSIDEVSEIDGEESGGTAGDPDFPYTEAGRAEIGFAQSAYAEMREWLPYLPYDRDRAEETARATGERLPYGWPRFETEAELAEQLRRQALEAGADPDAIAAIPDAEVLAAFEEDYQARQALVERIRAGRQDTAESTAVPEAAPAPALAAIFAPAPSRAAAGHDPGANVIDRALRAAGRAFIEIPTMKRFRDWMADQYDAPFATPVRKAVDFVRKQGAPLQRLPQEVNAKLQEMAINQAFAQESAMDVLRALGGKAKFSDLAYPPEFVRDKTARKRLFHAMRGDIPMESLPKPMQELGAQLRAKLNKAGLHAVETGRMHPDTFMDMQDTYMPMYFWEHEKAASGGLGGFMQRTRIALREIRAQQTTMFRIKDMEMTDQRTREDGALVTWDPAGKRVRFKSRQHRDAYYEEFVRERAAEAVRARAGTASKLSQAARQRAKTVQGADIGRPDRLPDDLRGYAHRIEQEMRRRYQKGDPLSDEQLEQAGLITDPVYAVAKHIATMEHDNATAEFFNWLAGQSEYFGEPNVEGYVELPETPRLGALSGRWVRQDVAEQVMELVTAPDDAARLYDGLLTLWKTGKTVYNLGTHVRNVIGNVTFGHLAGNNPLHPGNAKYYAAATRTILRGGEQLEEMFAHGVLGGDFLTAELRKELSLQLPDLASEPSEDVWVRLGQRLETVARRTGAPWVLRGLEWFYRFEDEVFKAAAYLKDREAGMEPEAAAEHVRRWFPYYDHIGSSFTIKGIRRTVMPFFSFYRESGRILANAVRDRPATLAYMLALPTLLSRLSAHAFLGMDDEEYEQVKRTSRTGKGKFFARETPLYSILLPIRSGEGRLQQWDLTNTHPFADFLGSRMTRPDGMPVWQHWAREMLTGSPLIGTVLESAFNTDTFRDRPIWEDNMDTAEKRRAWAGHTWRKLVPPLVPGGTSAAMIARAGTRQSNRSLERRDRVQAYLRAIAGIDIRNASPNVYTLAEEFRERHGIESPRYAGGSTPEGRSRARIYAELVQDDPSPETIASELAYLAGKGNPIETAQDVNRLLFYRNPIMAISGHDNQRRFRRSLKGEAATVLRDAEQEFARVQRQSGPVIRRAQVLARQTIAAQRRDLQSR